MKAGSRNPPASDDPVPFLERESPGNREGAGGTRCREPGVESERRDAGIGGWRTPEEPGSAGSGLPEGMGELYPTAESIGSLRGPPREPSGCAFRGNPVSAAGGAAPLEFSVLTLGSRPSSRTVVGDCDQNCPVRPVDRGSRPPARAGPGIASEALTRRGRRIVGVRQRPPPAGRRAVTRARETKAPPRTGRRRQPVPRSAGFRRCPGAPGG